MEARGGSETKGVLQNLEDVPISGPSGRPARGIWQAIVVACLLTTEVGKAPFFMDFGPTVFSHRLAKSVYGSEGEGAGIQDLA